MKKALIAPIAAPIRSAVRIVPSIPQPIRTFITATNIEAKAMVEATERSKSPVVSGMMRPSVRTTIIAFEPNIAVQLVQAYIWSGLNQPRMRTSSAQAMRRP